MEVMGLAHIDACIDPMGLGLAHIDACIDPMGWK
jgi:hypothetical protein